MARTSQSKQEISTKKAIANTFPDYAAGNAVSNNFFGQGSMGRVNAAQDPATQDIINRYQGIANQQMQDPRSAATQDYLNRFKGSLDGYSSAENQGMLEQANKGAINDYQNGNAQIAKIQAKANVRGPWAAAQSVMRENDLAKTEADNRQKLFVANADEKQKRLGEYGNAVRTADQTDFANRNTAQENLRTSVYDNKADMLNREKYNNEQTAAENAGRANSFFQTQGVGTAERTRQDNRILGEKSVAALARGGGRSSTGTGAPVPGTTTTTNPATTTTKVTK